MSLRLRLLVTLVPLFVAGLVAADVGTYASLQSFLLSRVDEQLVSGHPSIEASLLRASGGDGPSRGDRGGPGPSTSFPSGTYGELRSSSQMVLVSETFGFEVDPATHPLLPAALTPGTESSPALLTVGGGGRVSRYRAYVDRVNDQSGTLLVVALPLDDVDATLRRLLVLELVITGGVTVILMAATWLVVRRSLRPLVRMGDTARSIVASDLGRRVEPASETTEVGRLGLALNTMLGRLEEAFAQRAAGEQRLRHFVSDASHELRTPLTSMRGYAELLRRNPHMEAADVAIAMRRIEAETTRMGVLVDDLLLLARLDQGRPLERGPVDLGGLVADACADARAIDTDRAISSTGAEPAEPTMVVTGDEMRLRQVLGNLLNNALVHTPPGTPVEVRLERDGGSAVIDVIDHGSGIPPADAGRIFERFHQSDSRPSRDQGGSGLGLSIVAAVVAAHGGEITVRETPGGGATFRIRLPVTAGG
ncbi:MAG: HAMP domain-containing histidine kinase [Actinobacteria bacterium]|nr:HAMP domain-containing histidine kinase [Actinomycetota bacterium]